MQIYKHPAEKDWKNILKRPEAETRSLEMTVNNILNEVKENGDDALRRYSLAFDKVSISQFEVGADVIEAAANEINMELKLALQEAKRNIEAFHRPQLKMEGIIETMPGIRCWRKNVAIEKVGLYIPGGSAPLFSTLLMLGVPAKIAGCKEILLCSPPSAGGKIHPAILYTASLVGIHRVFAVGGVQAIAAMAYGTKQIPAVHKIFGPGNQFVTCAKQLVQKNGIAIDMPAGPSEVAIFADATANPVFVAADLLSQAEHGADSQVILVTVDEEMITSVRKEIDRQLPDLPRKDLAAKALAGSRMILVNDEAEAMQLINEYAPEHLILACEHPEVPADRVVNAGSVFLGHYSPESVGDYASGTNHTLPTNGYAKAFSGVSVDSFVKKISFQQLTKEALEQIGNTVQQLAYGEGLAGHAKAVEFRVGKDDRQ